MIQIRCASSDDVETIAEFQLRMAMETEHLALDREALYAGVRAILKDPRKGRYWVADVDGQVVGSLLVTPEWSDWRNGSFWWIQSLYVREEYRRQGVFRKLFGHLQQLVQSNGGVLGLRLYVATTNAAAQRAYEAMGMNGQHYRMYEWVK
jgi:GNAT superfamily N-acetyltransferase